MISLKEIHKQLDAIESNLNISDFKFKNIYLWPVIRNIIIRNFRPKESIIQKRVFIKFRLSDFNLFKLYKKPWFILNSNDYSSTIEYEKSKIHKQATPLKYYNNRLQLVEYSFSSKENQISDTTKLGLTFILFKLIFYPYKAYLKYYISKDTKSPLIKIQTSSNLNDSFSEICINEISEVFLRKMFYKIVFKLLKPTAIFIKHFDNKNSFSICLAANELGIKTIEYQHGQQGENSLSYSNWRFCDSEGYRMIPKCFWMWDEIFEIKLKSMFESQSYHKTLIGGNLWQNYYNEKHLSNTNSSNRNKPIILVSLQYLELPILLIETIKELPNFNWFIRVHPRHRNQVHVIENLITSNYKIDKSCINLIEANEGTIEDLLLRSAVSITFWSTVAYEALLCNTKSIVIHENGAKAYEKFIAKNYIHYTESKNELKSLINEFDLKLNYKNSIREGVCFLDKL